MFLETSIKAEVPVHDKEPKDAEIVLQQYFQQVESRSPENRLSNFCEEAGFMRVVEVGQYFVTKDTRTLVILDNFNQWLVANTPFHETTEFHKQKDGFKET